MAVPQKSQIELPFDPAITILGTYSKELKAGTGTNIYTPMFITALFIIAKRWKQPKCPLTNKMWSTHTMEYYSSFKRNLEHIMLSEIN